MYTINITYCKWKKKKNSQDTKFPFIVSHNIAYATEMIRLFFFAAPLWVLEKLELSDTILCHIYSMYKCIFFCPRQFVLKNLFQSEFTSTELAVNLQRAVPVLYIFLAPQVPRHNKCAVKDYADMTVRKRAKYFGC